jgi:FtsH-binding integral membrane protein
VDVVAAVSADDAAVVVVVVAARLLVPLLIPKCPLVIVAAFLLDAIDNGLLSGLTEVDLSAEGPYQSWDKALDIYYLSIAYLSTMRNWTSRPAFRIGQFLFYYRLVGNALFELLQSRAMLLVFPNTFEFFFIAYEAVRLRYDTTRVPARLWLGLAAGLWVLVKLPQEYWIHIAQRDFTDTVAEHPWFGIACAFAILALLAAGWFLVRPRLPPPSHDWRLRADPPPVPPRQTPRRAPLAELGEQVALLALLCIVYAEILPGIDATPTQVTVGIVLIVAANAAISVAFARYGRRDGIRSGARFATLVACNLAFVFSASVGLSDRADFQLGAGFFFALLITLIIWLYNSYKPLHDARFDR